MTNFTTKGVNETGSKFISYGVRDVKIIAIESKEVVDNSTPSIFISFQELGTEKTVSVRFPFSDKAAQYSLRKIKHLATKIVTEAEVDAITESTVTGYANALSKLILNKSVRIKFSGEEIDGVKNGKNNWYKSVINFPPFAEIIETNPTQLSFDAVKDLKKLPVTNGSPSIGVTQPADKLPF